jgi:hypothetical protein
MHHTKIIKTNVVSAPPVVLGNSNAPGHFVLKFISL